MKNDIQFSIVVFADDLGRLYRTFNNIKGQALKKKTQMIAVIVEEFERDERFDHMSGDSSCTIIEAVGKEDVLAEIKSAVKGEYVAFVKGGVTYDKKTLKSVYRFAQDMDKDIVITKVRGKHNREIREHNIFCIKYKDDITMNENICVLHAIYSAYYFKTDKLEWVSELNHTTWALDVMNMVYCNVIKCAKLGVNRDTFTHILNGANAIADWHKTFTQEDTTEVIFERFMKKIAKASEDNNVLYKVNAQYAVLYYCMRLSGAMARLAAIEPDNMEKYVQFIDDFLKKLVTNDIIVSNKYINKLNKYHIIKKYFPEIKEGESLFKDMILKPQYDKINVMMFRPDKESLHLEFTVTRPLDRENAIYVRTDNKDILCKSERVHETIFWAGVETARADIYEIDIPYNALNEQIAWYVEIDGENIQLLNVNYKKYTPFTKGLDLYVNVDNKLIYLDEEEMFVTQESEDTNNNENGENDVNVIENVEGTEVDGKTFSKFALVVKPYNKSLESELKKKRTSSLLRKGKPGVKAVLARQMYEKRKKELTKNIWLISDRTNRADDNGEVMFKYMSEHPDDTVEPYFVIDKGTDDYERMRQLGKVVAPFTREHKMLFLLNEFSLSSQANKAVINPFGRLEYLYKDLMYDKKLVFLQHGVTKDNQSKWLNKYNRNLFGFVVSTKPEYDSVFEYDYFYKEDRVWLTGMPRYDRLYHDEKKYITIMPTWRKSLSSGTDAQGVWLLGEEFAQSEYFNFYNDLLNDERLLSAAQKFGYTVCFMPHPNTIAGLDLFKKDERVKFMDTTFSYKDVFAQTDLMVTDYSSVAFDFAYLRKPIVYSQFDKEEFFNGEHSYTEGYFDYDRDGFGEVETTLSSTVDRIIEYMENGCKAKDIYLKRMDETFAFSDQDCSKRVYEEIIKHR